MFDTLQSLLPLVFFGTVICLAVAELFIPKRDPKSSVSRRWFTNIGLYFCSAGVQWLLVPISALLVAEAAVQSKSGLLNILAWPEPVVFVVSFLLLDLSYYIEHRMVHAVPLLWRAHRIHHADVDLDFTTAQRHHPFEGLLSLGVTFVITTLFGLSPLAIVVFFMVSASDALVAHANIRFPQALDRWLRWLIVTPPVHAIHHSTERHETDSNFGTILTLWDRLFGTYRRPTEADDEKRVLGLKTFREAHWGRLDRVLLMPFVSAPARTQGGPKPDPKSPPAASLPAEP